eukprot:TRINITY_DN6249_c0_g1_i1.p2 TRINITY_DN6249_c0_g1~~TRINITY_DN6249_c0_g1_i1.p2  ORF type:complete len:123 (-),score=11.62 TRINITY_DN6249_c0_g1_i1:851-1219(-)
MIVTTRTKKLGPGWLAPFRTFEKAKEYVHEEKNPLKRYQAVLVGAFMLHREKKLREQAMGDDACVCPEFCHLFMAMADMGTDPESAYKFGPDDVTVFGMVHPCPEHMARLVDQDLERYKGWY